VDRGLDRGDREQAAGEAEPDHGAGGPEAVDLGQHVPEQVREREDHEAGREDLARDLDELDRDDVRDDERRHEERGDRDEQPRAPHPA
jgi:hypothetical protein